MLIRTLCWCFSRAFCAIWRVFSTRLTNIELSRLQSCTGEQKGCVTAGGMAAVLLVRARRAHVDYLGEAGEVDAPISVNVRSGEDGAPLVRREDRVVATAVGSGAGPERGVTQRGRGEVGI